MVIITYVVLAWLGLAFGSFVNALVWRLHMQSTSSKKKTGNKKGKESPGHQPATNYSIINGRSVCPDCRHQLAWYDLIPVLSWLFLKGRCRYCKKPISVQYPLVELALALVFTLSYAFWPSGVSGGQWVLFVTWLATSIGLMALLVYDARWGLLPSPIIYPTLAVAVIGRLIYLIGFETRQGHALLYWVLGVAVASGIFWLIYVFAEATKRELIGFGDVRLGLVTGTLLATPAQSFLMIFLASVFGVIFILPSLAARSKSLATKIPYGPFLITATAVCVLWGQEIVDWYKRVFLP